MFSWKLINNTYANYLANEAYVTTLESNKFMYLEDNRFFRVSTNKFSGYEIPLQINNSVGTGIVSLNNYYEKKPEKMFEYSNVGEVTIINNYYEKETFLDLDGDGFSDSAYYLDPKPLMFPFESYEFRLGTLILTNPYLIILSRNEPIPPYWDIDIQLFMLYGIFTVTSIISFFLYPHRKNGIKNSNLNKTRT